VRPVEVVSNQGEETILGKGLQPGERVVVDGQNQLRPGAKVQPRTGDAKGQAPKASADRPAPAAPGSGSAP
jgi:multidrug efflux system membrane fusion protein